VKRKSKQNEANNETVSSRVYLLFSFQGVNPVLLRTLTEYFPNGDTNAPAFPASMYYISICSPSRSFF